MLIQTLVRTVNISLNDKLVYVSLVSHNLIVLLCLECSFSNMFV